MDSSFPVLAMMPTRLRDPGAACMRGLPPELADSEIENPAGPGKPSDAAVLGVRLRGAIG